jgi:hypothetical protein
MKLFLYADVGQPECRGAGGGAQRQPEDGQEENEPQQKPKNPAPTAPSAVEWCSWCVSDGAMVPQVAADLTYHRPDPAGSTKPDHGKRIDAATASFDERTYARG